MARPTRGTPEDPIVTILFKALASERDWLLRQPGGTTQTILTWIHRGQRAEKRREARRAAACCVHAKTRHRQQYGEPHSGACRDCPCQKYRAALR